MGPDLKFILKVVKTFLYILALKKLYRAAGLESKNFQKKVSYTSKPEADPGPLGLKGLQAWRPRGPKGL